MMIDSICLASGPQGAASVHRSSPNCKRAIEARMLRSKASQDFRLIRTRVRKANSSICCSLISSVHCAIQACTVCTFSQLPTTHAVCSRKVHRIKPAAMARINMSSVILTVALIALCSSTASGGTSSDERLEALSVSCMLAEQHAHTVD